MSEMTETPVKCLGLVGRVQLIGCLAVTSVVTVTITQSIVSYPTRRFTTKPWHSTILRTITTSPSIRPSMSSSRGDNHRSIHQTSKEEEAGKAREAGEQVQTQKPPTLSKHKSASHHAQLIPKVTAFVQKYMSKYDGSHDFNHIKRVVGLAHLIYKRLNEDAPSHIKGLDFHAVTLAALLHDVGDKKYLEPGQDGNTLVLATLLGFGAPDDLAIKVQRIVLGVSYSSEIEDPAHVQAMIRTYPELAIVQDADRLDAIGAIGIGRTFTYGGAKAGRPMGETIQHFEDKLEKLESMMKTEPGKSLARERTERLKAFKRWWEEEENESRKYSSGD